jgi:hypothetical protein
MEHKSNGFYAAFPECCITETTSKIVGLLESMLRSAQEQNPAV